MYKIDLPANWHNCPPVWQNLILSLETYPGSGTTTMQIQEELKKYNGRYVVSGEYVTSAAHLLIEDEEDALAFILRFS